MSRVEFAKARLARLIYSPKGSKNCELNVSQLNFYSKIILWIEHLCASNKHDIQGDFQKLTLV